MRRDGGGKTGHAPPDAVAGRPALPGEADDPLQIASNPRAHEIAVTLFAARDAYRRGRNRAHVDDRSIWITEGLRNWRPEPRGVSLRVRADGGERGHAAGEKK